MLENKREFILVKKKEEAEDITTLFLKPADGRRFRYEAGQYVNVRPAGLSGHGKSYTISSAPKEKLAAITIKKKGQVSSALIGTAVGDTLIIEGPYGYFTPGKKVDDIVLLAGGIGITPFYSYIKDKLNSKSRIKVILFYSNKKICKTAFFDELNELTERHANFKIVHCLTEEKKKDARVKEYGRINELIIKKYVVSLEDKCYYVCGSVGFVDDMWKMLKKLGVQEERIFTESFY